LERKRHQDYLGAEIFFSRHIKSDLYMPSFNEHGEEIGDRTTENLFIKGSWSVLCRHLRWVLTGKRMANPGFTYKIVGDARLLDVWLGKESYKARSASQRDEVETNNSLDDLVSHPTLLIIRLGMLTTKNKAMAGVLQQALMVREAFSKPVWIAESGTTFGDGHQAYSYDLGNYIDSEFEVIDLGTDAEEVAQNQKETQEVARIFEEGAVSMDDGPEKLTTTVTEVKPRFPTSKPRKSYNKRAWGGRAPTRTSLPSMDED
jgi:hypothetical protein